MLLGLEYCSSCQGNGLEWGCELGWEKMRKMRRIPLVIVCCIALLVGVIAMMALVPGGAMAECYFNLFPEFMKREVVPVVERFFQSLIE